MEGHGQQGHSEKHLFSKGQPLHGIPGDRREKEQVAEPPQIQKPQAAKAQKPPQNNSQSLGQVGEGRGLHRRFRRGLHLLLPRSPKACVMNFPVGMLRQSLAQHLGIFCLLLLRQALPGHQLRIQHKGVLSPDVHMSLFICRRLSQHGVGEPVSADKVADLIRCGKGRQHRQIDGSQAQDGQGKNRLQSCSPPEKKPADQDSSQNDADQKKGVPAIQERILRLQHSGPHIFHVPEAQGRHQENAKEPPGNSPESGRLIHAPVFHSLFPPSLFRSARSAAPAPSVSLPAGRPAGSGKIPSPSAGI